jgi:SAM-dependent MidA family methyltransferase
VGSTQTKSRVPSSESRLEARVRERGPLTVAAFMDLALYDPDVGYYARAAVRSGRAGDFFTSVDVGPLFGELLEVQLAEMSEILQGGHMGPPLRDEGKDPVVVRADPRGGPSDIVVGADPRVGLFDLVEAGAGNGRLSADILRVARTRDARFYESIRLHLIEASSAARAAQRSTLGDVADRLVACSATMPDSFEGALIANELLDALPVHQVVMREEGLREIHVVASAKAESPALRTVEGPPSTPALAEYLDRLNVRLEPGWRVEINLRAVDWMRDAARRLRRGFIVLIDYGHPARELYSPTHSAGTLTTYARHQSGDVESTPDAPAWLRNPGEQDLTAHVDLTSIQAAAEAEGLTTLAFLDQTYFLLGLLPSARDPQSVIRHPQFKTLLMPGGLGSTHKVLIFAKGVGTPALRGCSFKVRVT